jgi:hypothetical protein
MTECRFKIGDRIESLYVSNGFKGVVTDIKYWDEERDGKNETGPWILMVKWDDDCWHIHELNQEFAELIVPVKSVSIKKEETGWGF